MSNLPPNFQLSIYQQGLIDFVNNPEEKHAICNAVAGSGKSTTLYLVALSLVNRGINPEDIKVIVFGKQNSLDLIAKFGEQWRNSICTLHSLGYSLCTHLFGKIRNVDKHKYKKIGRELGFFGTKKNPGSLMESKAIEDESQFLKLFDLARFNLGDYDSMNLEKLALHHNLDKILDYRLCSNAMCDLDDEGMDWTKERGVIDYTDMIYLPTASFPYWQREKFKPCKYALIDECQDLNPTQLEMSLHLAEKLVYVGDPKQSIYGFAGAGIDSYQQIKLKSEAVELPLSVSYRCPASHINLVNNLFPEIPIRPTTDAIGGTVALLEEDRITHIQDDLILSRKTAPLVKYCLKLISQGMPAKVKGRDIGNGLTKEIGEIWDYAQKAYDFPKFEKFLSYCDDYKAFKQKRWYWDKLDAFDRLSETLDDKLKTIEVVYSSCDPSVNTPKELKERVHGLFSDTNQALTLCTVHRAKGLEADRVFILNPNDMPLSWQYQKKWEYQQELNILYVALTRSKRALYLMSDEVSWLQGVRK